MTNVEQRSRFRPAGAPVFNRLTVIARLKPVENRRSVCPAARLWFPWALGLLGLGLLLVSRSLAAELPAAAFDQANKFYEQGKYGDAAAAYEKLLQTGAVSSALYFNLGNAWFKAGQTGRAIAAYRQAEWLAPRDPDVRANLQFARKAVTGGADLTVRGWAHRLQWLSLNEWAVLLLASVWGWFLLLAAGQWRPEWKKALRDPVRGLGLALVISGVCLGLAADDRFHAAYAVVIVREGVARQGPLDESKSAFALRDGLEVVVLDHKDAWAQVRDSTQRLGWVKRDQLLLLRPAIPRQTVILKPVGQKAN